MFERSGTHIITISLCLILAFLSGGPALANGQKKTASAPKGTTSKIKPAPSSKLVSSPRQVASYSLAPGYTVKPADIVLPTGVPIGQYRRTFQPFPNWTLICDENLAKKQKVCNIAQTIVGPDGSTVFSWSLAAAQDGQPIFILRAPPSIGEQGTIHLSLPDSGTTVSVSVQGCNSTTCLAYQPVGQHLRTAVEKGLVVEISYTAGSPPDTVSFRAPLDGLTKALASI